MRRRCPFSPLFLHIIRFVKKSTVFFRGSRDLAAILEWFGWPAHWSHGSRCQCSFCIAIMHIYFFTMSDRRKSAEVKHSAFAPRHRFSPFDYLPLLSSFRFDYSIQPTHQCSSSHSFPCAIPPAPFTFPDSTLPPPAREAGASTSTAHECLATYSEYILPLPVPRVHQFSQTVTHCAVQSNVILNRGSKQAGMNNNADNEWSLLIPVQPVVHAQTRYATKAMEQPAFGNGPGEQLARKKHLKTHVPSHASALQCSLCPFSSSSSSSSSCCSASASLLLLLKAVPTSSLSLLASSPPAAAAAAAAMDTNAHSCLFVAGAGVGNVGNTCAGTLAGPCAGKHLRRRASAPSNS